MRAAVAMRVGDFQCRVVFQPVPLIDCIITLICGMANEKINKELSVLKSRRVSSKGTLEIYPHKRPLSHFGARDAVRVFCRDCRCPSRVSLL